jgi:hypothetical protein
MTKSESFSKAVSTKNNIKVNLREALLAEHSKALTLQIVSYIGDDKERFGELMHLFLNDVPRITQRSAWAVGYVAENSPHLIEPYLVSMLQNLSKNKVHDAIARNTVRALKEMPNLENQSEEVVGLLVDVCFRYLEDPSVAVAIKAFSMIILDRLCVREPDLLNEMLPLIEDQLPHATPAFKGIGMKILTKWKQK